MTITDILELLIRFKYREITTKYLLSRLDETELEALFDAERAKSKSPPVQEASPEVDTKIQSLFEQGISPAGSKEYFHIENRLGKHCWETRQQREAEQGIVYTDKGSPPFAAQRKSLCSECGQAIEPGDGTILRSRERGVA